MSVSVSKCGKCGCPPKAREGEEDSRGRKTVKLKCTGCGISTGDCENVGMAVKQWEELFEK